MGQANRAAGAIAPRTVRAIPGHRTISTAQSGYMGGSTRTMHAVDTPPNLDPFVSAVAHGALVAGNETRRERFEESIQATTVVLVSNTLLTVAAELLEWVAGPKHPVRRRAV